MEKEYYQYKEKIPYIKDFIFELQGTPYTNLVDYRDSMKIKRKVLNRAYYTEEMKKDKGMEASKIIRTNLLHSPLSAVITERFFNLLQFPSVKIAQKNGSIESINSSEKIKALFEWGVRTSCAEDAYIEQTTSAIAYGDGYVRDNVYEKPNRGNKAIDRDKYGYYSKLEKKQSVSAEVVDGESIMFDPCGTSALSDRPHIECSYYAQTEIYDKRSLVKEFGPAILKYAEPGWMVDGNRYSEKAGVNTTSVTSGSENKDTANQNFYEVIKIVDSSTLSIIYLVGNNGFPAKLLSESGLFDKYKEKKHFDYTIFSSKYPYTDYKGDAKLGIYPLSNYKQEGSIRSRGVVDRIYGPQMGHEISLNIKQDGLRQNAQQIKYVKNVKPDAFRETYSRYKQELRHNIEAILVLPKNTTNLEPDIKVVRPESSITDTSGSAMIEELYGLSRDSVGVEPRRQEIQANLGLGQTEQLAEEQVRSVQGFAKRNYRNINERVRGLLALYIRNNGFGIKEKITFDEKVGVGLAGKIFRRKTEELDDKTVVITRKRTATISEICSELEGEWVENVYVDQESIVTRSTAAFAEAIVKMMQHLNPSVMPEEYKAAMRALFKTMKIEPPENDFAGAENITQASGGGSQFQSQEEPNEER